MEDFDRAREAGILVPYAPAKPRVIVATAYTSNYKPLADITVPTIYNYCQKHGYDFYHEPQWEITHPDMATIADLMKVQIYKWLYLDNEVMKKWDVFMWIDADALIMNSEVEIDALLDRCGVGDDHHFLWAADAAGPNSGVYFARFTWQAHAFMHQQHMRCIEMGWGDNAAMVQVALVHPFNQWVKCVDGKLFNAYLAPLYGWERYPINQYEEGDFIVHLAGLQQERRIELARDLAAAAK